MFLLEFVGLDGVAGRGVLALDDRRTPEELAAIFEDTASEDD